VISKKLGNKWLEQAMDHRTKYLVLAVASNGNMINVFNCY